MIKFESVNVEVADGREKRLIIDDLNITLPSECLIGLIGNSGSGKSTIFNLISHEIIKTSGKIYVNNYDFDTLTENDENILRRDVVSYISQDAELYNDLTFSENVLVVLAISGIKLEDVLDKYEKYIKLLGLEKLVNERISNLSGGERQRLAIFINVLRDTKIILSDEPTSSLDDKNSHIVLNALKEISKDKLVIVSSHNVSLLKEYTNLYFTLEYGHIVENTIQNIDVENKVLSPLVDKKPYDFYMVGKKILYHQIFRRLFSVFMLTLSMIFVIVTLFNVSFNEYDFMYCAYSKYDENYIVLSDNYSLSDNTLKSLDIKGFNNKYDYYYNCNIVTYDDVFSDKKENAFIKNVIIDTTLNDNDIMITDYLYNELIENDITTLKIRDINLNIVKKIPTEYKRYNEFDGDKKSIYMTYPTLSFYNAVMNKNTFEALRKGALKSFIYNEESVKVHNINTFDQYSLVVGQTRLDKYEIGVDPRFLYLVYGSEYTGNDEDYIDKSVNLSINNQNYEFTIKMVFTGDNNAHVYFSNSFLSDMTIDVGASMPSFKVNSSKDIKRIIEYAKNNDYELINPYTDDINSTSNEYLTTKKISMYILLLSTLLFMSITIYLNVTLINYNRRSIGILRRYGCSRRYISKLLLIDGLSITLITIVLSIISYIAYYVLNNQAIEYNTIFSKYILPSHWWITIVFAVVVIGVELITLWININLLKKKDNKKLLRSF